MKSVCAVTTCSSRNNTYLPATLKSLAAAGYDSPLIVNDTDGIGAYGNWILSAHQLTVRNPKADLFCIFQDDILASRGLKELVEQSFPRIKNNHYLNLITYPDNVIYCPGEDGWYPTGAQNGKGAQGLVFDRKGLFFLLTNQPFYQRRFNTSINKVGCVMGQVNVDGGICDAMREHQFIEMVHFPSPLQHVGTLSAIGNAPQPSITCWRGEEFDLRTLL